MAGRDPAERIFEALRPKTRRDGLALLAVVVISFPIYLELTVPGPLGKASWGEAAEDWLGALIISVALYAILGLWTRWPARHP